MLFTGLCFKNTVTEKNARNKNDCILLNVKGLLVYALWPTIFDLSYTIQNVREDGKYSRYCLLRYVMSY